MQIIIIPMIFLRFCCFYIVVDAFNEVIPFHQRDITAFTLPNSIAIPALIGIRLLDIKHILLQNVKHPISMNDTTRRITAISLAYSIIVAAILIRNNHTNYTITMTCTPVRSCFSQGIINLPWNPLILIVTIWVLHSC